MATPDPEARALSLVPFRQSWRARPGARSFTEADIVPYLAAPAGAQLSLPYGIAG